MGQVRRHSPADGSGHLCGLSGGGGERTAPPCFPRDPRTANAFSLKFSSNLVFAASFSRVSARATLQTLHGLTRPLNLVCLQECLKHL